MAADKASGKLDRRKFLQRGLLGGGLLVLAGTLPLAFRTTALGRRPRRDLRLLNLEEHAALAAVAARIVPGDGAEASWPTAEAVDCAGKIDALLATVHPDVGDDFRRLLLHVSSCRPTTEESSLWIPPFAHAGAIENPTSIAAARLRPILS